MNPKGLSLVTSLPLLFCPASNAGASLTVLHVAPSAPRLPDETPEPAHPPHGEGSGDLLIFTGISASGTITNVSAQAMSYAWEPTSRDRSQFDHLFPKRASRVVLKVLVKPQRPLLPRARRLC